MTLPAIGKDDVDGECGQGAYPLLHAVANALHTNDANRIGTPEESSFRTISMIVFGISSLEHEQEQSSNSIKSEECLLFD